MSCQWLLFAGVSANVEVRFLPESWIFFTIYKIVGRHYAIHHQWFSATSSLMIGMLPPVLKLPVCMWTLDMGLPTSGNKHKWFVRELDQIRLYTRSSWAAIDDSRHSCTTETERRAGTWSKRILWQNTTEAFNSLGPIQNTLKKQY